MIFMHDVSIVFTCNGGCSVLSKIEFPKAILLSVTASLVLCLSMNILFGLVF